MIKNDYASYFEAKFQHLRSEGSTSYNSVELYQSSLAHVLGILKRRGYSEGRLLELGCASGDLSYLLACQGFESHGIDIAPTAIALAQEKYSSSPYEIYFRHGSVLDLPYEDGMFDVVVDALCFHCIVGDDRAVFLDGVHRVLGSGGLCIIMTKCGDPKDPDYPFDPETRCKIENGVATRYWGKPDDLVLEIQSHGFRLDAWRVHDELSQPLFLGEAICK